MEYPAVILFQKAREASILENLHTGISCGQDQVFWCEMAQITP